MRAMMVPKGVPMRIPTNFPEGVPPSVLIGVPKEFPKGVNFRLGLHLGCRQLPFSSRCTPLMFDRAGAQELTKNLSVAVRFGFPEPFRRDRVLQE